MQNSFSSVISSIVSNKVKLNLVSKRTSSTYRLIVSLKRNTSLFERQIHDNQILNNQNFTYLQLKMTADKL